MNFDEKTCIGTIINISIIALYRYKSFVYWFHIPKVLQNVTFYAEHKHRVLLSNVNNDNSQHITTLELEVNRTSQKKYTSKKLSLWI